MLCLAWAASIAASAAIAGEDAKANQIRAVMKSLSRSVVPVEFIIELSLGFQKRRAIGNTVGVVASKDGVLIVNSAIFSNSAAGRSGVVSKPTQLSVVLRDGRRVKARYLGLDQDRGLAFLRIATLKGTGLMPVQFELGERPEIAEEVIAVGRLPQSHNYSTTFMLARVSSIQTRPVPMIGVSEDLRRMLGCPVATLDGRVIGIVAPGPPRMNDRARIDTLSMALNAGAVVLPADAFWHQVQNPPKKKAKKGWLGIEMQALTKDIAKALGISAKSGIIVSRVFRGKGFAAEKAGIQEEDIIVRFDGKALPVTDDTNRTLATFRQTVRDTGPKSRVSVDILREKQPLTLTLDLSEAPKEPDEAAKVANRRFGLVVREITFVDALEMRIGLDTMGVLVAYVERGSWASLGGLRPGDVVQRVGDMRIRTVDDFKRAIDQIVQTKKDAAVPVLVLRGNETVFVRIEPDWR